jgi:hypothetical protein
MRRSSVPYNFENGADRDRTDDLYVANVPLSQLSYSPISAIFSNLLIYGNPTKNQAVLETVLSLAAGNKARMIPARIDPPPT